MKIVKRHYVICLELDSDREESFPDDDEVQLQVERSLTENREEFGILNASVVPCGSFDLNPTVRRRLDKRVRTLER